MPRSRRCAPEQQEPGPVVRPTDKNPYGLEEGRQPLHFVDNHQSEQAVERLLRHLQPPAINRRFEIEIRALREISRDRARHDRLAALARTRQCHDRMNAERLADTCDGSRTGDDHTAL